MVNLVWHWFPCAIITTWSFANQVGPKKAREMWFLSRFYDAYEAEKMGLVNVVVPVSQWREKKKKAYNDKFFTVFHIHDGNLNLWSS